MNPLVNVVDKLGFLIRNKIALLLTPSEYAIYLENKEKFDASPYFKDMGLVKEEVETN